MKNQVSLKQTLIGKFEAQQKAKAIAEAEALKITERETEERFTLFFGQKPERVEGSKAFFDDVILTRNCGYDGGWSVSFNCTNCQKEYARGSGSTFEKIGELIFKGAGKCYSCDSAQRYSEQSSDDQLLQILRDFILDNCHCD